MIEKEKKNKSQKEYEEINVIELADYLTMKDFHDRIKGIPERDIIVGEIVDSGNGLRVESDIHPTWASMVFDLREQYIQIIREFKKKDNEK